MTPSVADLMLRSPAASSALRSLDLGGLLGLAPEQKEKPFPLQASAAGGPGGSFADWLDRDARVPRCFPPAHPGPPHPRGSDRPPRDGTPPPAGPGPVGKTAASSDSIEQVATILLLRVIEGSTRRKGPRRRIVARLVLELMRHEDSPTTAAALAILARVESGGPMPTGEEL